VKTNRLLVTQIEQVRRKQDAEFGDLNKKILNKQDEVRRLTEQRKQLEAQVRDLEKQLADKEFAFSED
jgi:predicted  nucleic acid-binding Zn-ribbon protein